MIKQDGKVVYEIVGFPQLVVWSQEENDNKVYALEWHNNDRPILIIVSKRNYQDE